LQENTIFVQIRAWLGRKARAIADFDKLKTSSIGFLCLNLQQQGRDSEQGVPSPPREELSLSERHHKEGLFLSEHDKTISVSGDQPNRNHGERSTSKF
jgi:hypothetical protein